MSFYDNDIELTDSERKLVDSLYVNSPAELIGTIRAAEGVVRNLLGGDLTDRLLSVYKSYDKGKTEIQGKLGANY